MMEAETISIEGRLAVIADDDPQGPQQIRVVRNKQTSYGAERFGLACEPQEWDRDPTSVGTTAVAVPAAVAEPTGLAFGEDLDSQTAPDRRDAAPQVDDRCLDYGCENDVDDWSDFVDIDSEDPEVLRYAVLSQGPFKRKTFKLSITLASRLSSYAEDNNQYQYVLVTIALEHYFAENPDGPTSQEFDEGQMRWCAEEAGCDRPVIATQATAPVQELQPAEPADGASREHHGLGWYLLSPLRAVWRHWTGGRHHPEHG